ncbi:MAG: hypothetical protein AB1505_11380 [Candidatus Latescibacterota bacterium]
MAAWGALTVLLGCSAAAAAVDQDSLGALSRQVDSLRCIHRRMALEEALAAGPDTSAYLVVDLRRGEFAVKVTGVVLRSAPLLCVDARDRGPALVDTSVVAERVDLPREEAVGAPDSLTVRADPLQADTAAAGPAGKVDSVAARGTPGKAGAAADSQAVQSPPSVCQVTLGNGLRMRIAGTHVPSGSWMHLKLKATVWLARAVRPRKAPDVLVTVPDAAFRWVAASAVPGRRILFVAPGPSS